MRFDICSACVYFQPELKTMEKRIPKSCKCPRFVEWFSEEAGGFP